MKKYIYIIICCFGILHHSIGSPSDSMPRLQLRAYMLNACYGDVRLGLQVKLKKNWFSESNITRFTSKDNGGWMLQTGLRRYYRIKKNQTFGFSFSLLALQRYQHLNYDMERSDYDSAGQLVNYITTNTFSGHLYTDFRKKVLTGGFELGAVLPVSIDPKHHKWSLELGVSWRYLPLPHSLLNLHRQDTDPYTGNTLYYNYFYNPELNSKWYVLRQGSACKVQFNLCYNLR